jgi:hypothetical protein
VPAVALVVAGVVALLCAPRTPAPRSERAHLVAIAAFGLVSAALTVRPERLGPFGPAMNALFDLPGLDGLRGRSRTEIFVTFAAATVLGIAFASILRRVRHDLMAAFVVLIAISVIVLDTRTMYEPLPVTTLPTRDDLPDALKAAIAVDPTGGLLHLPYGRWPEEVRYMMWALQHERPIMNGYTGVMPRFSAIVRKLPGAEARDALVDAGITHVLVHLPAMAATGDTAWLAHLRAATDLPQLSIGDAILVTLPRVPRARPPLDGRPIPRDGWRLDASDPGVRAAADGDLATHWTAATIDRATFLRVDLGTAHEVTGVRLELGPHLREYPHAWELRGSRDGDTWTVLGGAQPTRPPFGSYRRDHRAIVLDLPVTPATIRVLELRVPGQPSVSVFGSHTNKTWGVHEIVVLERSP